MFEQVHGFSPGSKRIPDFQPGWRAVVIAECDARLGDLGVAFMWPILPSDEYIKMLGLMERGGLREAERL